ncbi:MAG: hypothetical protein LQ338_000054 [Usnochroma carphineum]|nr:MAG: hypothetical protein LQ338_000054 [Usnochroma carphineum]
MSFFQFGVTTDVPEGREFTFRQPVITGKRAAIAQAAYEAGFDCSNPSKLLHLLDAVVMANNRFGYPDYWDGPAAFQSSVYPDTWTPAHAARQEHRQRNAMSYDDEARPPTVPAFAVSATEIVRTLNKNAQNWQKSKNWRQTTGANREPLRERSNKKRTAGVQLLEDQSFKRPKVENRAPAANRGVQARAARSNVSRPVTSQGYHTNRATAQRRAAKVYQADAVAAGTDELLERVVGRLNASITNLDADREALKDRWEVDKRLQVHTVTEHLKTLNECFTQSEEALRGSVEVIEQFIM